MKREVIAFLVAPVMSPVVPAAVMSVMGAMHVPELELHAIIATASVQFLFMLIFLGVIAVPIAYVLTALLALPIYALLRDKQRATYPNILILGSLIGLIPMLIFAKNDPPLFAIPVFAMAGAFVATIFWLIRGQQKA